MAEDSLVLINLKLYYDLRWFYSTKVSYDHLRVSNPWTGHWGSAVNASNCGPCTAM